MAARRRAWGGGVSAKIGAILGVVGSTPPVAVANPFQHRRMPPAPKTVAQTFPPPLAKNKGWMPQMAWHLQGPRVIGWAGRRPPRGYRSQKKKKKTSPMQTEFQ
ncbi:uncharacterized protein TM35_000391260 [Trypanosoma theileri]|uniref:Uncharacterized protein n=1 Tax=Trypanosoma theileri TaxID=67003 RepID=A0A1X0NJM1_9TRYP|nr:uncharacterized protein TM35_000391260 [Trypanosoma theileri]ORC84952.1 hypothetical protein TM35_000391260 [Trypanosoma theileri]